MPNYTRPRIESATIFFTVTLADRGSNLLIREIEKLRDAFIRTMVDRKFAIDAIVILPDHLHAVITLPAGDDDYATRWRIIKGRFSSQSRRGICKPATPSAVNAGFGNGGFGSIIFGMRGITAPMSNIVGKIR